MVPIKVKKAGPSACISSTVVLLGSLLGPATSLAILLANLDSFSLLGDRKPCIKSPKRPPARNSKVAPITYEIKAETQSDLSTGSGPIPMAMRAAAISIVPMAKPRRV